LRLLLRICGMDPGQVETRWSGEDGPVAAAPRGRVRAFGPDCTRYRAGRVVGRGWPEVGRPSRSWARLAAAGGAWGFVGKTLLVPPVRWLAAAGYPVVARYRYRLPGGTSACKT
jgi:hypothetical protein